MGSCLAFLNSRFLLKSWVDESLVKRFPQLSAFNEVIRRNEFYVVFLLRLSPLVPYNALNYCLGVMPVGFVPYTLASFFGKPAPPVPPACEPCRVARLSVRPHEPDAAMSPRSCRHDPRNPVVRLHWKHGSQYHRRGGRKG